MGPSTILPLARTRDAEGPEPPLLPSRSLRNPGPTFLLQHREAVYSGDIWGHGDIFLGEATICQSQDAHLLGVLLSHASDNGFAEFYTLSGSLNSEKTGQSQRLHIGCLISDRLIGRIRNGETDRKIC